MPVPRGLIATALTVVALSCAPPRPVVAGGRDAGWLVSPDRPLDAPLFGPAYLSQRLAAAAFGDGVYLLAWMDSNSRVVRATRVAFDGRVLDPDGLVLGPDLLGSAPAVGFDGTNFLVAWSQRSTGGSTIVCARVTPDGQLLDPSPIVVRPPDGTSTWLAVAGVAFAGDVFLIVWESGAGSGDIQAVRVSSDGEVRDATPISIAATAAPEAAATVTSDGERFLVAWERSPLPAQRPYEVRAVRITPQGQKVDATDLVVATATDGGVGATDPFVAWDSLHFWVVWTQEEASHDVYAARIEPSTGVALPPQVVAGSPTDAELAVGAIADDQGLRPLWSATAAGRRGLFTAWLSPAGTALGTPATVELPFSSSTKIAGEVTLALGARQRLVVWTDSRAGRGNPVYTSELAFDLDVYAARVTSTPQSHARLLDPDGVRVSSSMNPQVAPAAAFDGQNYLVVWADRRAGSYDVYGARLSAGGVWLDAPFVISAAPDCQYGPAVAFDGQTYLVAWEDFRDDQGRSRSIFASRVTREGVVLDPAGIPIALHVRATPTPPSVAAGGSVFLVTWMQQVGLDRGNVFGARVSPAGQVLDSTAFAISVGYSDSALAPSSLFDGTQFIVAWEDYVHIHAARVRPDATVLDFPVALVVAPKAGFGSALTSRLGLAYDGTRSLVVWNPLIITDGGVVSELRGARLGGDGAALDPTPLVLAQDLNQLGAWATYFDGTDFRVAWEQQRELQTDLWMRAVPAEGAVLGEPAPLVLGPLDDATPAFATGPDGAVLVYSRVTRYPSGDVPRLQARLLPAGPSRFTSTPEPLARCGQPWSYTPTLSEPGAHRFEVAAPEGQPLPDGLAVDPEGTVSWTPAPGHEGEHALTLWAFGASAAAQPFTVTVQCDGLVFRRVAVGCAAAPWPAAAGVLALLVLRRRARR